MATTTTMVGGKEGGGSSSQIPPRKKMFSGRLGRGTASTLEEKEKEGGGKTGGSTMGMGIGQNESISLPSSASSSSSSSGVVTHVVYSKGLSKGTSSIFHHNNQNQNNHHHNNSNSNHNPDQDHHDEGRTSTSNNTVDAIATGCSRGMIKIWGMQYRPYSYSATNANGTANGTATMLPDGCLDKASLPPSQSPSSTSSSPSSSSPLPPLRSVELVVALEVHEGKALTALALTDVVVYPSSSPLSSVPTSHPIHPQQSNDHHSHSHNSDSKNDTPSTSSVVSSRSSSKHRGLEGCRWLVMSGTLLRIKKDTLVHSLTDTLSSSLSIS